MEETKNSHWAIPLAQWKMDGYKRNLNCFYSIFAKKRNSDGHFKYIENIKLYLGIVVLVLSLCVHPPKNDFYLIVINLPV